MNIVPIYKLLSDETRLRVLLLLAKDSLCVCEICGILDEPQPKISKIMSKLRDLDLVKGNRIEKFVFYNLKEDNALLMNSINFLLNNIEHYDQLNEDQHRLVNKFDYIDQCALDALKGLNE